MRVLARRASHGEGAHVVALRERHAVALRKGHVVALAQGFCWAFIALIQIKETCIVATVRESLRPVGCCFVDVFVTFPGRFASFFRI